MDALPQTVDAPRGGLSGSLDQVAWVPRSELDKRQWLDIGRTLGRLGRYNRWWVGDWLLYALGKWGEMYTEAARVTGFDYGSLRNMTSVARQFDRSRRRDKLSWAHHADVASLEPAEQDYWLDRAVELRLTREDLRTELRAARRLERPRAAPRKATLGVDSPNSVVCPNCGEHVALPHGGWQARMQP